MNTQRINWDNIDEHIFEVNEEDEGLIIEDINTIEQQWTSDGTKLLISLRVSYAEQFLKAKKKGKKNELWEIISNEMLEKKYKFSSRQCDEKWRRLLTQYRRTHDAMKTSGNNAVKWQYYHLMQQALEPTGKKQTMSPSKSLLHESSISPLVYRSRPSVSSTLSQQHLPVSSATSEYSGDFVSPPIVQQHMSVSSPASEYSGEFVSPPIVQQHTSVSSPASEYSGDTVSPPIVQKHTYLSTPTSQRCESPKNTKTHWMKEIIAFKQVQNDALTKRLDKLEEREGEMLRVQQQLVVKLEEANDIEKQKLELFRTMFSG